MRGPALVLPGVPSGVPGHEPVTSAGRAVRSGGCARYWYARPDRGRKGAIGLMTVQYHHFLLVLAGTRDPGKRPDSTGRAQPSVDGARPGRQASGTRPSARALAPVGTRGGSTLAATARDPCRPPGRPPSPGGLARRRAPRAGSAWCLPRQADRTVPRQMGRPPRSAGAPAGPGRAGRAVQRRNVPAGGNRD